MASPFSRYASSATLSSLFSRPGTATPVTPGNFQDSQYALDHHDVSKWIQEKIQTKVAVVLVGLPGSGKSTVCKQLCSTLNKQGLRLLVYNAGNIRRAMETHFLDAEFFNPDNTQAHAQRERYAAMCVENMLEDFRANRINVGFLDATNTTRGRRRSMVEALRALAVDFTHIYMLNVTCTDRRLLAYNVTSKAFNMDYRGRDVATLIADFQRRAQHYFRVYEPVLVPELDSYEVVEYLLVHDGRSGTVPEKLPADLAGAAVVSFVALYLETFGTAYHQAVAAYLAAAHDL